METATLTPARRRFPRELLWNLTLRELRGKYKRSILGWGWSLLNPIVFLGIYSFVFTVLFRQTPPVGDPSGLHNYAFFLVVALLPWTYHQNCVNGAVASIAGNVNLIRKVYFPRLLLPGSTALSWLITFGIEISVLTVALLFGGQMPLPYLPFVVAVALLQTAFSLGIGLVAAALNAFFRDVEYLTYIVLQIWFWATPIVWPDTLLVDPVTGPRKIGNFEALSLIRLNPLYHYVEAYRDLLYHGRLPDAGRWGIMIGTAAVSILIGLLVFRRVDPRLAEEL